MFQSLWWPLPTTQKLSCSRQLRCSCSETTRICFTFMLQKVETSREMAVLPQLQERDTSVYPAERPHWGRAGAEGTAPDRASRVRLLLEDLLAFPYTKWRGTLTANPIIPPGGAAAPPSWDFTQEGRLCPKHRNSWSACGLQGGKCEGRGKWYFILCFPSRWLYWLFF